MGRELGQGFVGSACPCIRMSVSHLEDQGQGKAHFFTCLEAEAGSRLDVLFLLCEGLKAVFLYGLVWASSQLGLCVPRATIPRGRAK